MCDWNLFLMLLTNILSFIFISFEFPKEEADLSKSITYIRKKKYKTLVRCKKNVILLRTLQHYAKKATWLSIK